ncbi:MAG: restriction endonuclease subunit S [Bacteroidetes bacterium]|nr:MAG: restriction endonuclease subunit S [Bacteroidota bacterium]
MNQYEKYKPIEFEWIGEIPSHWNVKKIKYTASINDDTLPETTDDNLAISYVDISSIDQGRVASKESYYFVDAPSRARRTVKDGDIIVSTVRTYLKAIARIKKPEVNLVVSTGFAVIRPYEIVPDFLGNLFLSDFLISEIISRSVGVSYPAINSSQIGEISIPIPPPPEQIAIANFLDEKTSQIDKLISNKKKLIELLKEERISIIAEAVNGKNKAWKQKKLKYVAKLRDEIINNSDFKISVENIESGTGRLVNMESGNNYEGQLSGFRKGDTIFNKLRPYLHKVYLAERDGGLFGELLVIYPSNEVTPEFLFYKLFSKEFIDIVDGSTQGTKMPRANWNDFISQLIIAFPNDKNVQSEIVNLIQKETIRIDETLFKIGQEVELLQEYRTALISEAVTGKIKVV